MVIRVFQGSETSLISSTRSFVWWVARINQIRLTWLTINQLQVGTPTEDTWPGVSRLPNYRPHKLCYYKPSVQLGHVWPRLYDIPFAEHVASMMLQSRAGKRVSAEQALRHRYFSDLPSSLHSLHPQESVYSIPGLSFFHDHDRWHHTCNDIFMTAFFVWDNFLHQIFVLMRF